MLNVKSLATLQEYAGQGIGPLIDSGSEETASEEAVLLITVEKIGKKLEDNRIWLITEYCYSSRVKVTIKCCNFTRGEVTYTGKAQMTPL